jgi:REP element-mobilizing transposase RayT
MSELVRKSHNVSVLIYHYVCPARYRRVVFDPKVDEILKEVCLEISKRYEIEFIEIGTDRDHVHFLVQSVPMYSPKRIIQIVKRKLWGGKFWTDGYYVNTVSRYGSEETVRKYVKEQGTQAEYQQLHCQQLELLG